VGVATFSEAYFDCSTNFFKSNFMNKAEFRDARFNGDVDFRNAEFGDDSYFSGVKFAHGVNFSDSNAENFQFDKADLTDATFSHANLANTNFESALLSRATLFGADLRGAKLSGAVLGDVRIGENTKFLGHPSDDDDTSPHTFATIRSRPCCAYDPRFGKSRDSILSQLRSGLTSLVVSEDTTEKENNGEANPDKAKSVYQALEELGGKHARPRLQARSFVRRQDLQKEEYKQDAKQADSWEERLIAGARYSRAKVARATLLYGESPWRVIAYSLSIILGFALLFPLGGWMKPEGGDPITYAQIASNPLEILNSVYYSTLTFTALGFGDFKPVGFGRALTTIETGLGAVLLALLVFILGRRAAR
jgi:uncharacterized protein YjbI with pentapeptide repeats